MAIVATVETAYDDSGIKAAQASIEGAGTSIEKAGADVGKKYASVGATIGDAFREGARGAGDAVAAAATVIASGGSMGDAWAAAGSELALAAQNMVAAIGETAIAEHGAAIASKAWAAAQWLVNTSFLGFPLVWLLVGLVAIIAVIVLLWKKSDTFRRIVTAAFDGVKAGVQAFWDLIKSAFSWIGSHWKLLLAILTGPIGLAVLAITANWDKIKAGAGKVIDWIKSTWQKVAGWLTKPFDLWWSAVSAIFDKIKGAIQTVLDLIARIKIPHLPDLNPFSSSSDAVAFAAPQGFALGASSTRAGSVSTTNLSVSGAVDAEGTARVLQNMLDRHASRQGRVSGAPRRRAW